MTLLRRAFASEVRSIDDEARAAEFVAATETPVRMGSTSEVLLMKGLSLDRYERNPVVLDSHRMESALDVVGTAAVRVEGQNLVARIRFDQDAHSEAVWQKVRSKSLRGLSIGYRVDPASVRTVRSETTGEQVSTAHSWELYEVSVVPVPADAGALLRAASFTGGTRMSDQPSNPQRPSPEDEEAQRFEREAAVTAARAKARAARHAEVRALCPAVLHPYLEGMLLEDPDVTVESARKLLLAERKRSMPPVGTPEPQTPAPQAAGAASAIDWDKHFAPLCAPKAKE